MKELTHHDRLTGALIGLARAVIENDQPDAAAYKALVDGLCAEPESEADTAAMIGKLHAEKRRIAPNCSECASPCGRTADCDMEQFYSADEDVVKLKSAVLQQLRETANSPASQARSALICEVLFRLGFEDDAESLTKLSERLGTHNNS